MNCTVDHRAFDSVLVHFGSAEVTELWTYVIQVFGVESPICAIIMRACGKAVKEMYVTIADDLRAEGRAVGKAEALLQVLEHRALPAPVALRERVLGTADESLLQRWLGRALTADSLAAVFDA